MKSGRLHIMGGLLVVIFMTYWVNINFYSHTHEVEGEILVHSHPYTCASHSHTGASYSTIGWLSASFNFSELVEYISLEEVERFYVEIILCGGDEEYYSESGVGNALRGPPHIV